MLISVGRSSSTCPQIDLFVYQSVSTANVKGRHHKSCLRSITVKKGIFTEFKFRFFLYTKNFFWKNLIKRPQTKTNNECFKVERLLTSRLSTKFYRRKTGGHWVTETLGVVTFVCRWRSHPSTYRRRHAAAPQPPRRRPAAAGPCSNDMGPEVPGTPIPSLYLHRRNANGAECVVYFFR